MAEMVWCLSCRKVVWAYDHQRPVDLRGIMNMLQMPCPKCGKEGCFDGWGALDAYDTIKSFDSINNPIYDDWSAMKYIAKLERVEWCPSGDNRWFYKENDHTSKLATQEYRKVHEDIHSSSA